MIRSKRALAALVVAVAMTGTMAAAQTSTGWKGTNSSAWSDAGNWDNGVPGTSGAQGSVRNLFYGNSYSSNTGGVHSAASNNDLNGYVGFRITFETNGAGFTLTGNDFSLVDFGGGKPKIENFASNGQIFSNNITLSGNGTGAAELNPINGDMSFSGNITTSSPLDVYGSNGKRLTFSNALATGGNALTIQSGSNVRITGSQTGGGDINVLTSAGRLEIGSGGSGGSVAASHINSNGTIAINRTGTLALASQITGSGSLVHSGTGTTSLTNANSYTGGTTITNGTVRANNGTANSSSSATGSSVISVTDGGTLGGNGRINNGTNKITIGTTGTITAGSDSSTAGTLITGDEAWQSGGTYLWKLNNVTSGAGSGWDQIQMGLLDVQATGGSLSNRFTISAVGSSLKFAAGHSSFVIATFSSSSSNLNASTITNLFKLDTTSLSIASGQSASYSLQYNPGTGSAGTISIEVNASPEPTTALLFGTSSIGILAKRRRRHD